MKLPCSVLDSSVAIASSLEGVFGLIVALFLDGYFVNIQNEIRVPSGELAGAISLSAVVGTLGYQWKWNDYLSFYAQLGHTIRQKGILRDNNRNDVYLINSEESLYFRTGLKVSIF